MRANQPSVLIKKFTKEVFENIIAIYAAVAGIKNPCGGRIDPENELPGVLRELSRDSTYCEWRLGSSLSNHSKLFLYPYNKKDGLHVGFDFDPNTYNDEEERSSVMQEEFREKVRRYLESL